LEALNIKIKKNIPEVSMVASGKGKVFFALQRRFMSVESGIKMLSELKEC
jgi:hypothetical protein